MTLPPPFHPKCGRSGGFALVAVLSLMILLVVVAVGLLTLGSITLRTGGQDQARAQAQANARLAMSLGFAQLQKLTGADQRITAPADVLAEGASDALPNAGWRGVWRSNTEASKSFEPGRTDFFTEWLVTSGEQAHGLEAARTAIQGESAIVCQTDGFPDVRVPLLSTTNHGRLGWWTDDESLKARADFPLKDDANSGELAAAAHAAPRFGPEAGNGVVDFKPTSDVAPRLITPGQLKLAATKWPDRQGRSFTTYSQSVLTNVRDGGLKQDLSTLFELPKDSFKTDTNLVAKYGQWTGKGSETNPQVYFYGPPEVAMGARWNHLFAYYNLYKDVSFDGSEPRVEPKGGLIDWHLADAYQSFGDEAGGFRYPRMAKIIYVFSYTAVMSTTPVDPTKPYLLQFATDYFITLWNPFDVRIHFPLNAKFYAKLFHGLPMKFEVYKNGTLAATFSPNDYVPEYLFNDPYGDRQFSMSPGETVVFSLKKNPDTGSTQFWPGVYFTDGMTKDITSVTGDGSEKISVGLLPDQNANAATIDSFGNSQYLDFWIKDSVKGWPWYEHRGEILARADAPFVSQMKPVTADQVPSVALADVVGRKQPFGAFIMETKTARDSVVPIPAFLNTGTTRLSSKVTADLAGFANERLEYKVAAVSGYDSDIIQVSLPNGSNGPNHGFIGSGSGPGTGQTHFLFSAVPTVPPTSLSQFRHAGTGDGASTLRATYWGFNSTPNAPYADQAIGNSYAHPLVSAGATSTSGAMPLLDHRYLGNEVLWDKYFFSSLAPRSAERFGTSKTMWQTLKEFLNGKTRLINPRFSPWLGEETPDAIRHRLFKSDDDSGLATDAYEHISANLMLDGGFNVNSTSVDAWRAFLASTRKLTLTKLTKSGGTQGTKVIAKGTVFSRTETVLSDSVDSGAGGTASHYSGYRDLGDDQIGKLATAIIDQVRKRGPFLNLTEFINRRPGGDQELALSGPLQTAIDNSGLNQRVAAGGLTGTASPGGASMAFPKASSLNTAAGCTGWLMQGDVLDPLGPSIVVRGDTFRIRGYGESRDATDKIIARAWCEAVVQRIPEYVDATEKSEVVKLKQPLNVKFGRRYRMLSFRWLVGPQE